MNIKHIWTVLCRESVINSDDNNISLNAIFEELTVFIDSKNNDQLTKTKLIKVPNINYEIVSLWYKTEEKKDVNIEIEVTVVNPDGKEINKFVNKFNIKPEHKRFRSRLKINGITVQGNGDYWFIVKVRENDNEPFKKVAEVPLQVKNYIKNPQSKN